VIVDIAVVPKKNFLIHSNFCANSKTGRFGVKMVNFEGFLMVFGLFEPKITSSLSEKRTCFEAQRHVEIIQNFYHC